MVKMFLRYSLGSRGCSNIGTNFGHIADLSAAPVIEGVNWEEDHYAHNNIEKAKAVFYTLFNKDLAKIAYNKGCEVMIQAREDESYWAHLMCNENQLSLNYCEYNGNNLSEPTKEFLKKEGLLWLDKKHVSNNF